MVIKRVILVPVLILTVLMLASVALRQPTSLVTTASHHADPIPAISLGGVYLAQAESGNSLVLAAQAAEPTKLTRYLPTDTDVQIPIEVILSKISQANTAKITLYLDSAAAPTYKSFAVTPATLNVGHPTINLRDPGRTTGGIDVTWSLDMSQIPDSTKLTIRAIFHTAKQTDWLGRPVSTTSVKISADVKLLDAQGRDLADQTSGTLEYSVLLMGQVEVSLRGIQHRKIGSSDFDEEIRSEDITPDTHVFPGDRLSYLLKWTNNTPAALDTDDFELRAEYALGSKPHVSFLNATNNGHLLKDAAGNESATIVWKGSDLWSGKLSPRVTVSAQFNLQLAEKIPFTEENIPLDQLRLTPIILETTDTQLSESGDERATELWGEVRGRFTVTDDKNAGPQPVRGAMVVLFTGEKENKKRIGPANIVTGYKEPYKEGSESKLGIFELPFRRAELADVDIGGTNTSVYLDVFYNTAQIPDFPYPMRFGVSAENGNFLDNFGFRTEDFEVSTERLTHKDIHISAISGVASDAVKFDDSFGVDQDQVYSAAAVWKNYWNAITLTDDNLGINIPKNLGTPLQIYFSSSGGAFTEADGTIYLSADIWKLTLHPDDRRYANYELHELGHIFNRALGTIRVGDTFSQTLLSRLGFAKIPEVPIFKNHAGARNDSTSDSLEEGFALLMSVWWNQLINPNEHNDKWDFTRPDGSASVRLDWPRPALGDFMPRVIPISGLTKIREFSEAPAIAAFMKHYLTGGEANSEDYGWTKQQVSVLTNRLKNNEPLDLSIPRAANDAEIWRRLKIILGALQTQSSRMSGHREEMFADFYQQLAADSAADSVLRDAPRRAAILMGMFRDGNADWAYDPEERLGQIAHDQAVKVGNTLFGGRPWRDDPSIRPDLDWEGHPLARDVPLPAGAAVNLVITDASGNPTADAVPITVSIDFAPPYQRFNYSNTFTSRGGLISLLPPSPLYITRAIIAVGSPSMPVLVIDSADFWQIISQDIPPAYVAKKTVNLASLQPTAVPDWPDNILVPAIYNSIELINLVAAKETLGEPTSVITAPAVPADDPQAAYAPTQPKPTIDPSPIITPTASSSSVTSPPLAQPRIITDNQAVVAPGQTVAVNVSGFAAPTTVTAILDKGAEQEQKAIATQRIITPDAQITVTIPPTIAPGQHTLTIEGSQGESSTLKLNVLRVVKNAAEKLLPGLLLTLALILLCLAGLIMRNKRYLRGAHLILAAIVLVIASRVVAYHVQPVADRFDGRRSNFVQLVPNYNDQFLLLTNFEDFPETYFGSPETISFIQYAAWGWEKKHPGEKMNILKISRHNADSQSRELGVLFYIVDASGRVKYVAEGDTWDEPTGRELAGHLIDTWYLLNPAYKKDENQQINILVTPPQGKNLNSWPSAVKSGGDQTKDRWRVTFGPMRFFPVDPKLADMSRGYWPGDTGKDIGVPAGTAAVAIEDSTVASVRTDAWGKIGVGLIPDAQGSEYPRYLYLHLDRANVSPGQRVKGGEILGYVDTATNGLIHLHFGIILADGPCPSGSGTPQIDTIYEPTDPLAGAHCYKNPMRYYLKNLWEEVQGEPLIYQPVNPYN